MAQYHGSQGECLVFVGGFFSFDKWFLEISLGSQKSWKCNTQSSPYPSPISFHVSLSHYRGTFVTARKPTLIMSLLTKLQTLFESHRLPQ